MMQPDRKKKVSQMREEELALVFKDDVTASVENPNKLTKS